MKLSYFKRLTSQQPLDITLTKIVGKTTYGKGKMQNIYALSDGSALVFTTGLFNPPCGVNFDGVGITPDVELELTTDGITDDQFYCALDELQKMIND